MKKLHDGECGLCIHFGTHEQDLSKLVQIRRNRQAPEDMIEDCGFPAHAKLKLQVTPVSGCSAFSPAPIEARPHP